MTASIAVRHNFETAHRLPFLGGKCTNLHGHSWWAEVTITGDPDNNGVLIDFGAVKASLREWIDTHLDHGAMLGAADPLLPALQAEGCKVFVFGGTGEDGHLTGRRVTLMCARRQLDWPTVENVADLLRRVTLDVLGLDGDRYTVAVTVTETHVNAASAS